MEPVLPELVLQHELSFFEIASIRKFFCSFYKTKALKLLFFREFPKNIGSQNHQLIAILSSKIGYFCIKNLTFIDLIFFCLSTKISLKFSGLKKKFLRPEL